MNANKVGDVMRHVWQFSEEEEAVGPTTAEQVEFPLEDQEEEEEQAEQAEEAEEAEQEEVEQELGNCHFPFLQSRLRETEKPLHSWFCLWT